MSATAIAAATVPHLRDLLDRKARLQQHAVGLFAVAFLAVYARLVCPFIHGLAVADLLANLLLLFAAQVAIRETLLATWGAPPPGLSLPRYAYRLSVAAWLATGLAAMIVHGVRYPDFPLASHVKLLSGYWLIGGGILAQWEFVSLENLAREKSLRHVNAEHYLERITRRVMEGFVLFTLAPSLAMALTVARYKYEGLVDGGMVGEIAFLGGFCVLLALLVSFRFGQSLRADAEGVLDGLKRLQRGEKGLQLDSSRLDELGAVASGINGMVRELETKTRRLESQLLEKDAMTRVSLAMSSVMAVDRILDLIVDNAKVVTAAEASSLLLLDERTGNLRFHVAKGTAAGDLASLEVRPGKGIVGHVAATGEPLLIPDAYADSRFDRSLDQRTGFRTRTLLTAPMISKGQVIGVVQVVNKQGAERFDEEDLHLLEAFAAQAAVSLENARLLEATRKMAEDLRVALERERNLAIEKEKMGAYVSKAVVDEISRNREQALALGGKTVKATVLFSDIKGFTSLSERLDPQAIVGFLNVYMTAMTEIIEAEGGVVDKFIGDGIMAVFTDGKHGDHAAAAVRAGVRMQQRLAQMRGEIDLVANLQMRVGINTGDVVAGNIGSRTRMDYTVIGDNVNVASRIEGACRPDCVMVSAATWERVKGDFPGGVPAEIHVKNRAEAVSTFLIDPAAA